MWCHISQPNSVVLEVEVDAKANGQECLDKVCHLLGIIEVDYFGLQYLGSKGETLWLNMRNQIRRQVTGLPPYRFQLGVKFFIPPHLILQDTTRHLFYLQVKQDLSVGKIKATEAELARLIALIMQAEFGDYTGTPSQHNSYSLFIHNPTSAFVNTAVVEHSKLKGIDRGTSEYWLLKEASALEGFGVEFFEVKTNGILLQLGVGTDGVTLYDGSDFQLKKRIAYSSIQMATNTGKCLLLNFTGSYTGENEMDNEILALTLESSKAANSLYRALTEKHAFYSCETVCNAVTTQFIRDLKGTIISLFNENSALGKKYVFDVRHTCREVYDNARRILYQMDSNIASTALSACHSSKSSSNGDDDPIDNETCDKENCKALRDKLATLQDAMLCRLCMDSNMNTAFCPCGHVICCRDCAALCERCPLCRTDVTQIQYIYLPSLDQSS